MLVPLHFYVRLGVLSPALLSAAGRFSLFEGEHRPSTVSPKKTLVAQSGLDILPRSQLIKIWVSVSFWPSFLLVQTRLYSEGSQVVRKLVWEIKTSKLLPKLSISH